MRYNCGLGCHSCETSRPPSLAPTGTHRPVQQLLPCSQGTAAGSWAQPTGRLIPGAQTFQAGLGLGPHLSRHQIAGQDTTQDAPHVSLRVSLQSPAATSLLQLLETFPVFAQPQPSSAAQPPQSPESTEGGGPFHNKSPTHFWPTEAAWSEVSGARKERVSPPHTHTHHPPPQLCWVHHLGWVQRSPNRASKVFGCNSWGGAWTMIPYTGPLLCKTSGRPVCHWHLSSCFGHRAQGQFGRQIH